MTLAQCTCLPLLLLAGCPGEQAPLPNTEPKAPARPPGKVGILTEGDKLMQRMTALEERVTGLTGGFDAVLGPRGPRIDLVINSLLFLGNSRGGVGPGDFQKVAKHPAVAHAVPIAMADNFMRYQVVGTTRELFEVAEWAPGKKHALAEGRWFSEDRMEAVLGGRVARELGMKVDAQFQPRHGTAFMKGAAVHETSIVVVGILKETRTPFDVVIWVPLAGVQNMEDHKVETSDDVNAVYLKWKQPPNPVIVGQLVDGINQRTDNLTLAWPAGGLLQVGVREMVGKLGGVEFWVREMEGGGSHKE